MNDQTKSTLKKLFLTGAVILVVGALAMGSMAFVTKAAAQTSLAGILPQTDNPDDGTTDTEVVRPFGGHGGRGLPFGPGSGIDYDAYLAEALGITTDELQAAYDTADQAALDEAVAQGLITEEQAALIQARRALVDYIDHDAIIAEALGITTDELQAARDEGKDVRDLIDELDLDGQTVLAAIKAGYQEAVQQAVDDGILTQDQADQIAENVQDLLGGRGGRGGHGRPINININIDRSDETNP